MFNCILEQKTQYSGAVDLVGSMWYIPAREWQDFDCRTRVARYAVAVSDGDFHQTSFVNNVRTERGGTHVSALQRPVAKAVSDYVSQKHTPASATTTAIRRHLRLFVNAKITNPSFDSQVLD